MVQGVGWVIGVVGGAGLAAKKGQVEGKTKWGEDQDVVGFQSNPTLINIHLINGRRR